MIVMAVAARSKDADFWGNVVSYRSLALSLHLLPSIHAVCTLLVSPLQVCSCVQTALSGTANTFSVVYKMLQVPRQINSLYLLLTLRL